jgi:hypothetical protein
MSAPASGPEQQTAPCDRYASFTSVSGKVKKGPCLDLSNILVDHPAPFVRCTVGIQFKLHAIDIVELVTGQTESTACETWAKIQETDSVYRDHLILFEGAAYLLPHFSALLVEKLPGNMTQEDRTLLANKFHGVAEAARPLQITTVMHEYKLVDNKSADIAKAVCRIAAQLYRCFPCKYGRIHVYMHCSYSID